MYDIFLCIILALHTYFLLSHTFFSFKMPILNFLVLLNNFKMRYLKFAFMNSAFLITVTEGKQMQLLLNVGGADRVSRLQMAEAVAEFRGYDASLIKSVSASSVCICFILSQNFVLRNQKLAFFVYLHYPSIQNY